MYATMTVAAGKNNMLAFFYDLPELVFLQNALIASLLCSVTSGIVGTYVVLRRISYIAAAMAHSLLGGIGVAKYLSSAYGIKWMTPQLGALIAGLLSAAVIGWITLKSKERADTVISAFWAAGMSIGIIAIHAAPGYSEDLMSYLFGNILMVSNERLWLLGIFSLILVALTILFYRQTVSVSFDEEFAMSRGVKIEFYYMMLLVLTALTVVFSIEAVGILMVFSLLTLPVAIASHFFNRVWKIMLASVLIGFVSTVSGLVVSYALNIPSGAFTILILSSAYFFLSILAILRKGK